MRHFPTPWPHGCGGTAGFVALPLQLAPWICIFLPSLSLSVYLYVCLFLSICLSFPTTPDILRLSYSRLHLFVSHHPMLPTLTTPRSKMDWPDPPTEQDGLAWLPQSRLNGLAHTARQDQLVVKSHGTFRVIYRCTLSVLFFLKFTHSYEKTEDSHALQNPTVYLCDDEEKGQYEQQNLMTDSCASFAWFMTFQDCVWFTH